MKKTLLYIILHFSSAVLADWITIEHDFKMCDQVVPSDIAAVHIDDDGVTYATSLLVRDVQVLKHEPPLTTLNVTMWGCTYDCRFSFMLKLNRDDLSVSSYTNENLNNYKCNLSNYTMKLIPHPKITYKHETPNPDHVFPTHLTSHYCSKGIHPDAPGWVINKTDNVAECIDHLTGNDVGTYAASLQYGSGSSYKPEGYGVATMHMINSANKLFDYWERHHRGFHEAITELSVKMTIDNLKELIPPPPPPPKKNLLKIILPVVAGIVLLAVGGIMGGIITAGEEVGVGVEVGLEAEESLLGSSEISAEIGAAEDVMATSAEGSVERSVASAWRNQAFERGLKRVAKKFSDKCGMAEAKLRNCFTHFTPDDTIDYLVNLYEKTENPNIARTLAALNRVDPLFRGRRKRDTVNNFGFFTSNPVNVFFIPTLMDNVHQSFIGNGQTYPDISSYLSAASEHLQFHFDDTLHNNFFAANKSVLASFTVNQGVNFDQMLDDDDDIYTSVKQSTYNNMAASIISDTLQKFNVEICDPKPSFCGQPCDSGHIYCPLVGNDTNSCVISAVDSQIKELKFLRDTFDICSKDNSTGWNITHNPNCDIKQFQCR